MFQISLKELLSDKNNPFVIIEDKQKETSISILEKKNKKRWVTYASAKIEGTDLQRPEPIQIEEIKNRLQKIKIKASIDSTGFVTAGNRWKYLKKLWINKNENMGRLKLLTEFETDTDIFSIHPSLLDSCVLLEMDEPGFVPVSCSLAEFYDCLPVEIYSSAKKEMDTSGQLLFVKNLIKIGYTPPLNILVAAKYTFSRTGKRRPGGAFKSDSAGDFPYSMRVYRYG